MKRHRRGPIHRGTASPRSAHRATRPSGSRANDASPPRAVILLGGVNARASRTVGNLAHGDFPAGVGRAPRLRPTLDAESPKPPGPSGASLQVPTGHGQLAEERRQVTVLYADLVGSTVIAARLDPEELRQLLGSFFSAIARQVARYDGTLDKYIGDAVMAVFGAPVSHENDAARALHAALAIRDAVGELNAELARQQGARLAIRMGVNTGEVVSGILARDVQSSYTIVGEAGVGKSRLVAEVRRSPGAARWLEGHAVSIGRTISYLPFLEMIRTDAGITDRDGESESWSKIQQRVRALFGEDVDAILPYLARLLGLEVPGELGERVSRLEADAIRRQIFLVSRRYFSALAAESPLLLPFEHRH